MAEIIECWNHSQILFAIELIPVTLPVDSVSS